MQSIGYEERGGLAEDAQLRLFVAIVAENVKVIMPDTEKATCIYGDDIPVSGTLFCIVSDASSGMATLFYFFRSSSISPRMISMAFAF